MVLKAIADYPNIFLMSGSIYDEDIIETVRKTVERVMFGTDGSFSSSMGKLLGCKLAKPKDRHTKQQDHGKVLGEG